MLSMMQKLSCCKAPSVHSGYMRTPTSEVATNLDAADTGLWRKVVYSLAVTFWISMWYALAKQCHMLHQGGVLLGIMIKLCEKVWDSGT